MESLRKHLDDLGIDSGDNRGFTVIYNGSIEMCVSRRYLESAPMEHYLDMKVYNVSNNHVDAYGRKTVCFWIGEQFDEPKTTLLL